MFINDINPVLLHIGSFEVRYYGLFIVFGIILTYFMMVYLAKKRELDFTKDDMLDLVLYCTIGLLVVTRLFYVVFYNPMYYLSHPLNIFALWEGGLSFHGGLIGIILGCYVFCKLKKKEFIPSFLKLADIAVIPLAFVLVFGRIANFLNSELVGRITSMPWAVNFNHETDAAGNLIYRHPSQLYEAGKNFLIFLVLWLAKDKKMKDGMLFSIFIIMYSVLRFFIEFFRAPDPQVGFLMFGLTMGQILNVIMFCFGLGMIYFVNKRKA